MAQMRGEDAAVQPGLKLRADPRHDTPAGMIQHTHHDKQECCHD